MAETATMFVAARRTVMAGTPPCAHGPGEIVTLPAREAKRLAAAGFLQTTPPAIPPTVGNNPASIGLQDAGHVQGPRF